MTPRLIAVALGTWLLASCAGFAPPDGGSKLSVKDCVPQGAKCQLPVRPTAAPGGSTWIERTIESKKGQILEFEIDSQTMKFAAPGIWFYTQKGRTAFVCDQSDDSRKIVCTNEGDVGTPYHFALRVVGPARIPWEYDPFVLNK